RSVAAVRAAHDSNLLRIGDALGDEILRTPGHVVLHLVAPLLVSGVDKLLAVTSRAAEVRLQDSVAAIREKLRKRIVTPTVAIPWTTMRQDNRGKILGCDTFGQR